MLNFTQKYIFNLGIITKATFSINCNGNLLNFDEPAVMGILNLTPDSFYDGGKFQEIDLAIEHTAKMLAEGAAIIDVGGASSRPDAKILTPQEELDRVVPVIEKLRQTFPNIVISIDTYYHQVASAACNAGASIVNDISGGDMDPLMFGFLADHPYPYILTHIQGTPQTMQANPSYEDVTLDVLKALSLKIKTLEEMGVHDIIIDPGFGFGKTITQNFDLLANLNLFAKTTGKPVLAGLSRKSMLYKPLGITPIESLNATTAANVIALQNGANILRVHDVKAAKEAIEICALVQAAS